MLRMSDSEHEFLQIWKHLIRFQRLGIGGGSFVAKIHKEQTFRNIKENIYSFAPLCVFFATTVAFYFEFAKRTLGLEDLVSLPAVGGWCLLFTYVFYFRKSFLPTFEVATYAFLCVHHLFRFYFVLRGSFGSGANDPNEYLFWIPFFYVCAYVIFPKRTALLISVLMFAATVVMGCWTYVGDVRTFLSVVDIVLQYYISNIVYIVLLYFLYAVVEAHFHAERLEELAFTDHLTQLPNRRRLEEMLQEEIRNARQRGSSLSVALIDIDHFKTINDAFGHDTGDAVLRSFGAFLSSQAGGDVAVGRWGGEEFMAVLHGHDSRSAAIAVERWRESLAAIAFENVRAVTASFGVAQWHADDEMWDLIKRADGALYAAKRSGRNAVTVG